MATVSDTLAQPGVVRAPLRPRRGLRDFPLVPTAILVGLVLTALFADVLALSAAADPLAARG